jgi:hypothetical protein
LLVVAGVTKRSVPVEVAALVPATAAATVVRFWMLRRELAPSVPSVPSGVPTRAVR